ncbi:MAG: hypothetical protein DMG22_02705 [Acidobacteria bacterium]|nr:MAG: hypothetical protein DMG22_02705 [Acidobacteriota bacterium]
MEREPAGEIPSFARDLVLNAGNKLGPYEVLSPLGAGGMGGVYRARDTRLARALASPSMSAACFFLRNLGEPT